jgi:pimeloyl-ACP methyl ester carboxylesterase
MNTVKDHEMTRANDAAVPYEVKGTGEPVLLISTGPIADSFRPFLSQKTLVERFQLITYRQRQISTNGHGPVPVGFVQHAADAATLLDHLGVRRAHVAGHSTGGVIALQMAIDRPDLVHTLALLEPMLMDVPSAGVLVENIQPALAAFSSGDYEKAMASFLSVASSLDWETCRAVIDTHIPGGVARAMAEAPNVFDSYLPALGAWRFEPEQAATISQPVLSVQGTETNPLFAEGNDLLHAWFPQIEDSTIEGVGHLLHLQRPEPVAREVAGFFARHPIPRD